MTKLGNNSRYPTRVFWNDEDEGWIAEALDLPGCSAFGQTREEACVEVEHAIAAWIEAASNAGNEIPHPTDLSERTAFSGRLAIRMPKRLHADLSLTAKAEGVSLNSFVVGMLTEANAALKVIKGMSTVHSLALSAVGHARGLVFVNNPGSTCIVQRSNTVGKAYLDWSNPTNESLPILAAADQMGALSHG